MRKCILTSDFHPPTFRLRYLLLLLLPAALFAYTPDDFFLPRPPLDDPFPIRRVYLSPEKFREQLAKDPDRVLVSLSAREFAGMLRDAPRATPTGVVRLVEQRYRATLVGDALAGGGEWTIVHSGKGAALLDVDLLFISNIFFDILFEILCLLVLP